MIWYLQIREFHRKIYIIISFIIINLAYIYLLVSIKGSGLIWHLPENDENKNFGKMSCVRRHDAFQSLCVADTGIGLLHFQLTLCSNNYDI